MIKPITDLGAKTPGLFDTPVVSASGHDLRPTPTDVHLYVNPTTAGTDHPILYADREGLEGGTQEPVAAEAIAKRAIKKI